MTEENLKGYHIYEIDNKTRIPKMRCKGTLKSLGDGSNFLDDLDLENKTYAIRIGKTGLK